MVDERCRDRLNEPQTHRRFAQYYDPAVRRQTARVELGCERFARDR
jgi:hypothetical protein